MSETKTETASEREAALGGIGCDKRRKEDARFIRGQGNYVDDLKLPNTVFGDFVRSPTPTPVLSQSTRRRPSRCPA